MESLTLLEGYTFGIIDPKGYCYIGQWDYRHMDKLIRNKERYSTIRQVEPIRFETIVALRDGCSLLIGHETVGRR